MEDKLLSYVKEYMKIDDEEDILISSLILASKEYLINAGGETKEGKVNEETVEIKFSVRELDTNDIYYFIDTDASDVDSAKVSAWYNAVQTPTGQAVLANQVEGRKGAK